MWVFRIRIFDKILIVSLVRNSSLFIKYLSPREKELVALRGSSNFYLIQDGHDIKPTMNAIEHETLFICKRKRKTEKETRDGCVFSLSLNRSKEMFQSPCVYELHACSYRIKRQTCY